jgi:hypothetical protein
MRKWLIMPSRQKKREKKNKEYRCRMFLSSRGIPKEHAAIAVARLVSFGCPRGGLG